MRESEKGESAGLRGAEPGTSKKMKIYLAQRNHNTSDPVLTISRLANARFHLAKALTDTHAPGQETERIISI